MGKTKIEDVIVPSVFNPYVVERTAQLSALYQSGIIASDERLNSLVAGGGRTINMPFWQDLSGDDEVLTDGAALGVDKIGASQDVAVLHTRGKAWSVNDLATMLSGADPSGAIANLLAQYWVRRQQALLISILKGIFSATSTGMDGNKLNISSLQGTAAVIGASSFLDAQQLMGDNKDKLTAVAMHSQTENVLAKANLIDYIIPSDGSPRVPYMNTKRVIVDDTLPVANGVYTTYLFGDGAIGYGEAINPNATETGRDILAGDDVLVNRRTFLLHPRGVKWLDASITNNIQSPTNADCELAANWSRVYEAKNVRIVEFKHKIASA